MKSLLARLLQAVAREKKYNQRTLTPAKRAARVVAADRAAAGRG